MPIAQILTEGESLPPFILPLVDLRQWRARRHRESTLGRLFPWRNLGDHVKGEHGLDSLKLCNVLERCIRNVEGEVVVPVTDGPHGLKVERGEGKKLRQSVSASSKQENVHLPGGTEVRVAPLETAADHLDAHDPMSSAGEVKSCVAEFAENSAIRMLVNQFSANRATLTARLHNAVHDPTY